MPRYKCKSIAALDIALGGLPAKMRVEADVGTEGITGRRKSRALFQQSPPRNGSQCRARLEFCAGSGRKKGRGLRDIRGVPLPCVTSVSTTSNLGLPRSVTSLRQSTLTRVLEGLLRRRILTTAVCILPGTELAFSEEVKCAPFSLINWRVRIIESG